MFRAKIRDLAKKHTYSVEFIKEEVAFQPDSIIIVDLMNMYAFDIIKKFPKQCICYGPHVMQGLFEKAIDLGCGKVHPRSAFFEKLKKLMEK